VHDPWQLANAPRIACTHPGDAGKWPIGVGVKAATAMPKAAMALNAAMPARFKAKAFSSGQAHHPQRQVVPGDEARRVFSGGALAHISDGEHQSETRFMYFTQVCNPCLAAHKHLGGGRLRALAGLGDAC